MQRRIVVIGFGAIGSEVVEALLRRTEPTYVVAVMLRPGSPSRMRVPKGVEILDGPDGLPDFAPHLVVEAAGHAAVREIVPCCLAQGLPVLLSSIGALHDEALRADLVASAARHGGRLLLPSGALGGLDYVRAACGATDFRVAYESRKPPAAWAAELFGLGLDAERLAEPKVLFEGTADEAAARYPQNLNVAAALALAGPGFGGVRVTVVCDPRAQGNVHEVRAESALGSMRITIANRPSPTNPKSSAIVAQSLLAAVAQQFSPVAML